MRKVILLLIAGALYINLTACTQPLKKFDSTINASSKYEKQGTFETNLSDAITPFYYAFLITFNDKNNESVKAPAPGQIASPDFESYLERDIKEALSQSQTKLRGTFLMPNGSAIIFTTNEGRYINSNRTQELESKITAKIKSRWYALDVFEFTNFTLDSVGTNYQGKIGNFLLNELNYKEDVEIFVEVTNASTKKDVIDSLSPEEFKPGFRFSDTDPTFSGTLRAQGLNKLQNNPNVLRAYGVGYGGFN